MNVVITSTALVLADLGNMLGTSILRSEERRAVKQAILVIGRQHELLTRAVDHACRTGEAETPAWLTEANELLTRTTPL